MQNDIIKRYLSYRARYPNTDAKTAYRWAKREAEDDRPVYFKVSDDSEVLIPGVGKLTLEIKPDECADPFRDNFGPRGYEWRELTERTQYFGAHVGGNWYSTGHGDRRKVLCIDLGRDGSYATRFGYLRELGYSKQDADVAARKAIADECNYWRRVADGRVQWYGVVVTLYDEAGVELDSDSVWGCDFDDNVRSRDWHGLEYANDFAHTLLAKHADRMNDIELQYAGM